MNLLLKLKLVLLLNVSQVLGFLLRVHQLLFLFAKLLKAFGELGLVVSDLVFEIEDVFLVSSYLAFFVDNGLVCCLKFERDCLQLFSQFVEVLDQACIFILELVALQV